MPLFQPVVDDELFERRIHLAAKIYFFYRLYQDCDMASCERQTVTAVSNIGTL